MSILQRLQRLVLTLRFLKVKQVLYRLKYSFFPLRRVVIDSSCESYNKFKWKGPEVLPQSLFINQTVRYLNLEKKIEKKEDWNCGVFGKLWLYNLHYFDDLNAINNVFRKNIHIDFVKRWVLDNPPVKGNGWEPYPLSLRLVNLVKWYARVGIDDSLIVDSIFIQAKALSKKIEYHILGNHLFANAKALVFVGCFLKGEDAEYYFKMGLKILDKEIPEQFLSDGGHFELTPMYHCILLWDLLDLINLAEITSRTELVSRLSGWRSVALKALNWLRVMQHPDKEVSFFNDSTMRIAATPTQLFSYAASLKLELCNDPFLELVTLPASGYSRISMSKYVLLFDHAAIGPDYLPGHAHADTLSFEMSVGVQRVFVNSGTSLYGVSAERLRQRETAAHNTVVVNGKSSSEVWSGFRVARRAYATLLKSDETDGVVMLSASHDGYKRLNPKIVHKRTITSNAEYFTLLDELSHPTDASFHLHIHPDVLIINAEKQKLTLQLPCLTLIQFECECPFILEESTWHPEFGVSVANKKIVVPFNTGRLSAKITILKDKS